MTDPDTIQRIKLLAYVGDALTQISNDEIQDSTYYYALSSLSEFREHINKLELDITTKTGIENLVKYLEKKITKRMKQSFGSVLS
jgi:hypothetical protein